MLDPIRLVADLFKEKNFTYANLRTFSEDFLVRLADPENNPGGIYNSLLVDTTNRYHDYYGSIENKLVKAAVQKGLTLSMNKAYEGVFEKLRRMHGLVVFKFGQGTAIYKEFFPHGMEPLYTATLGDLPAELDTIIAAANDKLLATHPAEVGELVDTVNHFKSARTAQELVFSEVKSIITGRHKTRKALTLQLTKCFLVIASDHLENPDRFHDYYQSRYLPIRKGKKKEDAKKNHHKKQEEKKDVFEF